MRHFAIVTGFVLTGLLCEPAAAEGIWFSFHEASGSGWGNVFDGGPPVTAEGATTGPDDDRMSFLAADRTQIGAHGATAWASGASRIIPIDDDAMQFVVDFSASYAPGLFQGGDNTGGAAAGELHSVIEFVMPVEELAWSYELRIDDTIDFAGDTHIVLENVTQGEILLDLTSKVSLVVTTLTGHPGDLLRLTSNMSGSGSTNPAPTRQYHTAFGMILTIPEPGSILLLIPTVLCSRRRGRR